MIEITPEQATQFVHQTVPAIGRLGVTVEEIGTGSVLLKVPIEGNANHMGTMYAGALFGLAELPGGLIPLGVLEPGKYVPIVTRFEVDFLAPARTDVTLRAAIDPEELQQAGRGRRRRGQGRVHAGVARGGRNRPDGRADSRGVSTATEPGLSRFGAFG